MIENYPTPMIEPIGYYIGGKNKKLTGAKMKEKIIIENENDVDWEELWTRKMDKKGDRGKDWSKAAVKYAERASKDNYTEQLISKMINYPIELVGRTKAIVKFNMVDDLITSTVIFRLKKKKRKTSVSSSIILHINGFS